MEMTVNQAYKKYYKDKEIEFDFKEFATKLNGLYARSGSTLKPETWLGAVSTEYDKKKRSSEFLVWINSMINLKKFGASVLGVISETTGAEIPSNEIIDPNASNESQQGTVGKAKFKILGMRPLVLVLVLGGISAGLYYGIKYYKKMKQK